MRPVPILLLAALSATACENAPDDALNAISYDASPDAAWHLTLSGLEPGRSEELVASLSRVDGVSTAALANDATVRVVAGDVALSEEALHRSVRSVGAALESIALPPHARVSVHTMTTAGGG